MEPHLRRPKIDMIRNENEHVLQEASDFDIGWSFFGWKYVGLHDYGQKLPDLS